MRIDPTNLDDQTTHDLLKGCVQPRPIAWVSTLGPDGVGNAAPYSCFTFLATRPPLLGFSIELKPTGKKDTLVNIEHGREFVVNIPTAEMAEAVNASAANFPPEVDEFQAVGLTPATCQIVKTPRIAQCPINLECRLERLVELGKSRHTLVIGEVVMFHIKDHLLRGGTIHPQDLAPLARLSGNYYGRLTDLFELARPWLAP